MDNNEIPAIEMKIRGKIWWLEKEIRHLRMRKQHPERYQVAVPMTNEVIDYLIIDLNEKIRRLKQEL